MMLKVLVFPWSSLNHLLIGFNHPEPELPPLHIEKGFSPFYSLMRSQSRQTLESSPGRDMLIKLSAPVTAE
jgi:hypothetical protein